jgi:hypothetical protein
MTLGTKLLKEVLRLKASHARINMQGMSDCIERTQLDVRALTLDEIVNMLED